MKELYILTNSPGEVSGWVKPTANAIADADIGANVTLAVLPCPYASGMEKRYGEEIRGVDSAMTFKSLWSLSAPKTGRRLVLQMGGDPMFGAALSAKFRAKWTIYTARPRWRSRVDHYFVPDEMAAERFRKARIAENKFTMTGNLMFDSVPECAPREELKKKFGVPEGEEIISFLSGSRPFEYRTGVGIFVHAAMKVLDSAKNYNAFLPIAPTVDEGLLERGLEDAGLQWVGERPEEILWNGPGRIKFIRGNSFEAMKASKLAVALPGTNNLQIASLGVPLLMVAPLNEAENIPLDGLPGLIPLSVPGAKKLKRKLVMWFNSREEFVSLPNRITGMSIVPEHRGIMTPDMIADLVLDLLGSPERLEKITENYSRLSFERGAAAKIASVVGGMLN
ncbi:MAG: hypothetical protein Q4F74_02145 [Synergistaceae bacterium]|nr:hypothetical protein [Synergistaceae bacterium]